MIGHLPKKLIVNGESRSINSDYRAALTVFEAYGDKELSALNKQLIMLDIIYDFDVPADTAAAQEQAIWFLDIGGISRKDKAHEPRTMDYGQDEQLLFSAVNAVAGHDVREDDYMHWWTFYGLCQAISPDALISHIVHLRHKLATGKKLEKHEREFYAENRHLIDLDINTDDYDALARALRGE